MSLPDFIIAGAPKCGTTSLSEYLGQHPRLFVSDPKEPHFFAFDFPTHRQVKEWDRYEALFADAAPGVKTGEASVLYLYSDAALKAIRENLPNTKLVVLLRNPVDLAISMHGQTLWDGDEPEEDFNRAWNLCESRRSGDALPKNCREPKILFYNRIALLGQQLERLLAIFPREQVQWWFFDDLVTETGTVYRQVLEFLGVEDDGRQDFHRANARREPRSKLLSQFVRSPPRALTNASAAAKKVLGIDHFGFRDAIREWNLKPGNPPVLSTEAREKIRLYFARDVQLLSELTGRDLSDW